MIIIFIFSKQKGLMGKLLFINFMFIDIKCSYFKYHSMPVWVIICLHTRNTKMYKILQNIIKNVYPFGFANDFRILTKNAIPLVCLCSLFWVLISKIDNFNEFFLNRYWQILIHLWYRLSVCYFVVILVKMN